jgi:FG-GAP-like repeat/FG-GAP repeat
MTRGAKIGLLLALACGCSVRTLAVEGNRDHGGGRTDAGQAGGSDGRDDGSCDPAAGAPGGHSGTPPVTFRGNVTVGAPLLLPGSPNPLGATPRALAIGDLDGDGRPDLVASGPGPISASVVSVSLNIGNGAFAPRVDHPVTAGSTSLARGDLNGDGRPDIVVGGEGGQGVEILFNTGEGTFRSVAFCACGGADPTIALADIDGDGSLDLVATSRRGDTPDANRDLVVLFNDGVNSFGKGLSHYSAGAAPGSLAVGDLNGDGRADVVTAGVCGGSVLLNAGDGRLGDPLPFGSVRGRIALADIDGDGAADIVDTRRDTRTVNVLLNDGRGRFRGASETPALSPVQTAIGDLNGDGRPDLVVATDGGDRRFSVLLNAGDSQFGPSLSYGEPDPAGSGAIAIADVDGDGRLDIVVTGDMSVTVFMNRGTN